jgi:hypothetical protein
MGTITFEEKTKMEELIKKKLGYTTEIKNCQNCKHSVSSDYQIYCNLITNVSQFQVVEHGSCDKFLSKDSK